MHLSYLQNRALLDTLRKLSSTGGLGHIALFNTLAIGHTKHANEQRISCWPFAVKTLRGTNSQDFAFIRPPEISHGAFELRMDNIWFCKVLLLFQVESRSDLGWKRHSCAFVSVLQEYTGPRRPGDSSRLLITLRTFTLLTLLLLSTVLRLLRILSIFYRLIVLILQRGWITVTQKLSTNAACSHKFFMSYQLLQYWVDRHLCLSVTLAPSHSPCARRHATFLAHPATRRRMLVTAIDGGTSIVLP
jgi:hypothetical protein